MNAEPAIKLDPVRDEPTPTERMHALGIEGEIVFSTDDPDELEEYLDAIEPCASST